MEDNRGLPSKIDLRSRPAKSNRLFLDGMLYLCPLNRLSVERYQAMEFGLCSVQDIEQGVRDALFETLINLSLMMTDR